MKKIRPAFVIIAVLSLIALFPLPYGYYMFLRIAVTLGSGAAIYYGFKQERVPSWAWASIVTAILFNPIIPIHLTREIWMIFNIASAVLFGTIAYRVKE